MIGGETPRFGGADWTVIPGYGHSPEHASLYAADAQRPDLRRHAAAAHQHQRRRVAGRSGRRSARALPRLDRRVRAAARRRAGAAVARTAVPRHRRARRRAARAPCRAPRRARGRARAAAAPDVGRRAGAGAVPPRRSTCSSGSSRWARRSRTSTTCGTPAVRRASAATTARYDSSPDPRCDPPIAPHVDSRHDPRQARRRAAPRSTRSPSPSRWRPPPRRARSSSATSRARQDRAGRNPFADELGLGKAFMELAANMFANPAKLAESHIALWQHYAALWQSSMMRAWGAQAAPIAEPAKGDKRFRHEGWQDHFLFDYIKQSYLIAARWLHENVASVEGLDEHDEAEGRLLHAPVHRRARAVELRADQSRGVQGDDRDRRPEPRQGPQQPARRHRARQRAAAHLDDRREGVRARRQHRDDARQGRVPQRR